MQKIESLMVEIIVYHFLIVTTIKKIENKKLETLKDLLLQEYSHFFYEIVLLLYMVY